MQIRKDAWHYEIYDFFYKTGSTPARTNICQYLRRILISAIPFLALLALALVVMFVGIHGSYIVSRLTAGIGWILGKKAQTSFTYKDAWNFLVSSNDEWHRFASSFEPYEKYRIGRWQFYPWLPIAIVLPITLLTFGFVADASLTGNILGYGMGGALGVGCIMFGAMGIYAWCRKPRRPKEPKVEKLPREPSLLAVWIRAKKEKICPLVEFVDPLKNAEAPPSQIAATSSSS